MNEIKIITDKISKDELRKMAQTLFGNLVKAVVDCEKRILVIGGELHADEEQLLLEQGSKQQDLWGINLYPDVNGDDWIEFDSMINIRPSQANRSRGVESSEIQNCIRGIVNERTE